MQAGLVRVLAADPKLMELAYGRVIFESYGAYAASPAAIAAMLDQALVGALPSRDRARCAPDEVVGQELSRLLLDSTADVATWLDARQPVRGGDLT
jgi:hypothetical protein